MQGNESVNPNSVNFSESDLVFLFKQKSRIAKLKICNRILINIFISAQKIIFLSVPKSDEIFDVKLYNNDMQKW